MSEFKGTKGKWYIERTSVQDGDFQARILSNVGKVFHAGEEKDQIVIIVGEPSKRNGQANIHSVANALLISKAPEMLEVLKGLVSDVGNLLGEHDIEWQQAGYFEAAKQLIKEATEL